MSFLSRRIPYDRKRLLERASARADTWRWRSALAHYRQILAVEPECADLHARVAPLLARSGRGAEAWESYCIAANGFSRKGDAASERTLLAEAVRVLPRCAEAWRALARAELARNRASDAVRALAMGSRRLTGTGALRRFWPRSAQRGEAIILLRDARAIEAWNPGVVMTLARLLAQDGLPAEALFLLDHLDQRVSDSERSAVRALTFRIEPSLRHAWRLLRSGSASSEGKATVGSTRRAMKAS